MPFSPTRTGTALFLVLAAALLAPGPVRAVPDGGATAGVASPALKVGTRAATSGEAVRRATERAYRALSRHVKEQSHPEALRRAFRAYFAYATAHAEAVRKPYFFFVDYGLDNRTARGYVFDMESLELVEGPFTVAHGSGSSRGRNAVPTSFSNRAGSYKSSLGLYLAQETYGFSGKSGGRRYTSKGLRLKGLSGEFNSAARRRGIVAHGAPYVTARDAGRSQGCPAMEQARARRLLPKLANGGLVYLFSPRDERWLRDDPWSGTGRLASSR